MKPDDASVKARETARQIASKLDIYDVREWSQGMVNEVAAIVATALTDAIATGAAGQRNAATITAVQEIVSCAQAVLTALNVGDVQKGSKLHLKLREVMILHRDKARSIATAPDPTAYRESLLSELREKVEALPRQICTSRAGTSEYFVELADVLQLLK